ncbi:MAG: hypothetical protein LBE18_06340 [Planctomycetaceae bacterium]|jgi:chromosomal replication initiator protein|nr:hypothetical protein [Planctomycetaceae bacterium]
MEYIEGHVIKQNKAVEKQIFGALAAILGQQRFDLWFGQQTSVRIENDKITFSVQSHVINWIRSSLKTEIEQACKTVLNKNIIVEFIAVNETSSDNTSAAQSHVNFTQHNSANKIKQLEYSNANANSNANSNSNSNSTNSSSNLSSSLNPHLGMVSSSMTIPITREIYIESGGTVIPSKPHLSAVDNFSASVELNVNKNVINKNVIKNVTKLQNGKSATIIIPESPDQREVSDNKSSSTGLSAASRNGVQSRYVKSPAASPILNIPRSSSRKFASLETFVEGLSNRLALRGIDLALNHPNLINPIYIYGPSGIGKTHLLEGLWSQVRMRFDNKPPLYMAAEQFVSGFLDRFQSGSPQSRNQDFRNKFKGISYFMLDDIQYFNRKVATQTEFLYVMDGLKSSGVQIVLTGDRPLIELSLRSEIISRLESGMSCSIELPERELLLNILLNMVKKRDMKLGEDVCRFICSRVGMNVRRITGALNRLFAISNDNSNITVESAEEILKDMFQGTQRDVKLSDIGKIVSDEFGLSEGVLQSRDRSRQLNVPRMLAMWLARKYTRFALSEIGRFFGERSHSTVVTAQKKVDQWIVQKNVSALMEQNFNVTQTLQNIERKLNGI